jgi:thioredoxin 1
VTDEEPPDGSSGEREASEGRPESERPEGRGREEGTDVATIGNVTDGDFEERVLGSEVPVLVDFWAEWCVPCHMVSPVVEEIGRDKGDTLQIAKLNIDENPEVTRRFGVMSIPTLMLFKAGEEIARVVGARGKDALLKEIDPHVPAA